MLARAILAFVALPGVVAYLIPLLIGVTTGQPFNWLAAVPIVAGTALLLWCVLQFYRAGKGTLAPWAPPRHLVTTGPYRWTRNPMYLALVLILVGWTIGFSSGLLVVYSLAALVAAYARVRWGEEPWLARTHRDEWTRYAARVPRWMFRRRTMAATVAIALLSLPVAGLIYEAYADGARQDFPPPGRLVDVGGRRLHLLCIGEGTPTVFFEPSGWGTSLSSARARERLAARTQVCSYDRAGQGWSDPGPGPMSTADLVNDLAVLQDRAGLQGPYVLVASSIGGLTAELFARQLPERVTGLVFLDAANSLTLRERERWGPWATRAICTAGAAAHFGILRIADPFGLAAEGTEDARRAAALTYNPQPWMQLCRMGRALDDSVAAFAAAPPLRGDLPLAVLSASDAASLVPPGADRIVDVYALQRLVRASHQELAKRSTKGKWLLVPDSTHLIGSSQPDVVAELVEEMLAAL